MKKEKLFKYLSFGLFATITVILMTATVMEKLYGTRFVLQSIYHSDWMIALWCTATLSAIVYILQKKLHKKPATLCIHLAFAVILTGAIVTYTTGKQGQLHLRIGEYSNSYTLHDGTQASLPFGISLHNFKVTYYAGTEVPMDYISSIVIYDNKRIEGTVSMNNIFKHCRYRFYQSGYDDDKKGTSFAISYDPWGIGITYSGYLMLMTSMLLFFFQPDSRFRTALQQGKRTALIVLLLFAATTSSAKEMGHIPPQENGIHYQGSATDIHHEATCDIIAFYNSIANSIALAIVTLSMGIILFFIFCINNKGGRLHRTAESALKAVSITILAYITLLIALHWYISGHIPLSNGRETMIFMAWCSMLSTSLASSKQWSLTPFGYIVCGLTLLVASMGNTDPHIAPLAPVLRSPLLSIHVVIIMISYTLFAFTMLNGIAAFIINATDNDAKSKIAELQRKSILMLYPAVFLLTAGIFIGATWANISWGRYWGWDPKEVWALITMLIYSATLHSGSIKAMQRPMFFHAYCIVAFLTVLITYFGVNYLLGGLHSYA